MSRRIYKSDRRPNAEPGTATALYRMFMQHEGDVSDKWEHYLPIYEAAFDGLIARGRPIRLLEIGVQNGGSLEIWSKYLPPGSIIVGIDIDKACANLPVSPNVFIHIGDASDPVSLDHMLGDAHFDVIIDDGSHRSDQIIAAFQACFPRRLNPNGLYIVEDLHCSYSTSYGGGFRLPSAALEWFKGLADALNSDHFERDASEKLDEAELQRLQELGRQIACVSFFDSVALIQRLATEKRQPYRRIMTGREAPAVDIASQVALLPIATLRTLQLSPTAAEGFAPTLLNALASAKEQVGELRVLLARVEAEWQQHASEKERERADWQQRATATEHELAKWQRRAVEFEQALHSTEIELVSARAQNLALLSSTSWKATWPLRRFGSMTPPYFRTLLRRSAKFAWWLITFQFPTKLQERRSISQASDASLQAAAPASPLPSQFEIDARYRQHLARLIDTQRVLDVGAVGAPASIPTLTEALRRQYAYLEPLRTYPASGFGRRLSVVTDGIDPDRLHGGVGTAIILGILLAQHLRAGLRLITRRQEAEPSQLVSVLAANGLRWEDEIEFLHAPSGVGDDVPVGDADLFLTTSWWTTKTTRRAVDPRRILYLLQEDERSFYPHGDERLRCAEILSDTELHFVVNSRMLYQHLIQGPEPLVSIRDRGIWFEPAFPETLFYDDREQRAQRRTKNFFFYARPENLRNLYWRGLEAVGAAIEEAILPPNDWRFVFGGRKIERIVLPCGVSPEIRENLPWAEYAALIRQIDLGLSLMDSPHPSYPPLDLAASGAVVVTNRSGLKRSLDSYSENIFCVDATLEGLKQGIARAAETASNETRRAANFARNRMLRDWTTAFAPVLQRCAEWVS